MAEEKLTKEQIVEKVKKLLSLADGTNFQGESTTAMNMARELLAKYNLSMSDVEKKKDSEENPHDIDTEVNAGHWQIPLAIVVAEYLNCVTFTRKKRVGFTRERVLCFVGMPAEVEICSYTYEMIAGQIDRMMRKKRREIRDKRERKGEDRQNRKLTSYYTRGYAVGIINYLKDSFEARKYTEKCTALVLVRNPKVDQWCNMLLEPSKPSKPTKAQMASAHGVEDGYRDGKNIQINPGLKNNRDPKLIG